MFRTINERATIILIDALADREGFKAWWKTQPEAVQRDIEEEILEILNALNPMGTRRPDIFRPEDTSGSNNDVW